MLPNKTLGIPRLVAFLLACALSASCVADRPSRNGVFNENQYLRKDFLVAPATPGAKDEGWFVKTTILQTSTPNVLAPVDGGGLFSGAEGSGENFVRFVISQDTLSLVSMRELSNNPAWNAQNQRTSEVVNAWPATSVDLKYEINLDGEITNFFQENQEADWQVRQWVKINFAKNNLSDLYAFGAENNAVLQNCTDPLGYSVTLQNNSFLVDEANGYFEFALNITVPIQLYPTDPTIAQTCLAAFGNTWQPFLAMGRQNVTLVAKFAFVRPSQVVDGTYVPMPLGEKDPIRHKYGVLDWISPFRDTNTGLLGADDFVMRHDPNKPIVYYFAPGMPKVYQQFFANLASQTNKAAFEKSGARARLSFLNYNDLNALGDGQGPIRGVGDPRYNFINWHSDLDHDSGLLGVEQPFADPRTGQVISASVNVFEGPFQDTVEQRLDLFLKTVGQEFLTSSGEFDDTKYPGGKGTCTAGQTIPLVPADVANLLNRQSTVYSKLQQYLQRPFAQYGYLGPANFLPAHDSTFYDALFAVLPYQIYADPAANAFVWPEPTPLSTAHAAQWQGLTQVGQFNALASQVDHGALTPPSTPLDATSFANRWESLSEAVVSYGATKHYMPGRKAADDISLFSYFDVYQRDGRHCVNGKWETRAEYVTNLITSLNMAVGAHEFGHALGLDHNFMGSVDQRNFPLDASGKPLLYASSLMDYNQSTVEAFFETNPDTPVYGPYDLAAIAFIYGNSLTKSSVGPKAPPAGSKVLGVSGQVSATAPWNDPLGFKGTTETQFLTCSDQHTRYTPLCQPYDIGVTPAEIVSNQIQAREWNYLWTNFRLYHKYFSYENYGQQVVTDFGSLRRFQTMWAFDWDQAELTNDLRLVGFPVPATATAADYYAEIYNKFETDISTANQLALGYQRAIIDQSSGERPYVTVFDPFFGDETQQGIQIDKVAVTTGTTGLWPAVSNFDPSQTNGIYMSTLGGQSALPGGFGDPAYQTVADGALNDFLGAAFATFQYTQLGPLATFSQTTHDPAYNGDLIYQRWIGAWPFTREVDFLQFVRDIAVKYNFQNCDQYGLNCQPCTDVSTCTWDPRTRQENTNVLTQSNYVNSFVAPDGHTYIWGYLLSRNQWILADKDVNTAMYALMLTWLTDVVYGQDTGENGASTLEYPVRFALDSYVYFDGQLPGSTGSGGAAGADAGP